MSMTDFDPESLYDSFLIALNDNNPVAVHEIIEKFLHNKLTTYQEKNALQIMQCFVRSYQKYKLSFRGAGSLNGFFKLYPHSKPPPSWEEIPDTVLLQMKPNKCPY
jgi:hypothetical protein